MTPLTEVGCAVLSLGHPVKAPNRQGEAYSYGAAGWLNDVDGASYRLTSSKSGPLTPGGTGASALCVVKDRYGEVKRWGVYDDTKDMPWYYMGSFVVDDTETGPLGAQRLKVTIPALEGSTGQDKYDQQGKKVLEFLRDPQNDHRFKSQNDLLTRLAAKGISVQRGDIAITLQRLANRGHIVWPEVEKGSRPGWLEALPPIPDEE